MRRGLGSFLFVVVLTAGTPVSAADQSGESPPTSKTTVQGAVPSLVGRWLVVAHASLPNGRTIASTQFWEVTNAEGGPNLEDRFVTLPKPLADALEEANAANRAWEPSQADLQALNDHWSELPSDGRSVASVEATISGKDALTDLMKSEAQIANADFVILIVVAFQPGPQRPVKEVSLFGATGQLPGGYGGNFENVTVAVAPFPIPIQLGGTFRMFRIEPAAPRGLLARMFDVFSGCGRRFR